MLPMCIYYVIINKKVVTDSLNILDIIDKPDCKKILDLLCRKRFTKEQIVSELDQGNEMYYTNLLNLLIENKVVVCDNGYYELCSETFSNQADKLLKYSSPVYYDDELENLHNDTSTVKSMFEHLFTQREENFQHASFDREVAFYESICTGDIEKVNLLATPLCSNGYGRLSNDPLRNLKYHFVVSVAMITRFCVNSGMTPEEAYNLSDVYIMKADGCNSREEIHQMHKEMILRFTKKMRKIKNSKIYSKQVIKAIDYISEHLHEKIKMQDVVDYLSLSIPYFSRLFKAETGVTFSDYLTIKKVEVASDMLRFSENSTSEISNILNFSSQSYFIKIFKKYTGMTPCEYKRKYNLFAENFMNKVGKE